MNWKDLEVAFVQAWQGAFSRRKWLLGFIALSLCGVLTVFCQALAIEASSWVRLSLLFLPLFGSAGLLAIFGVFAIRVYSQEKRGVAVSFSRAAAGCLGTAVGTSYFSFPPIFIYLCLWILLGVFFLLREIPYLGPFFNVVFAFGPFLLIFCSLVLSFLNVALLFFIVPAAAHRSMKSLDFVQRTWTQVRTKPFVSFILFFLGLVPLLAIGGVLTLAARITNFNFALEIPTAALAMEWFFVMLPFCALLSPAVIFFFQFAAESYRIMEEPSGRGTALHSGHSGRSSRKSDE